MIYIYSIIYIKYIYIQLFIYIYTSIIYIYIIVFTMEKCFDQCKVDRYIKSFKTVLKIRTSMYRNVVRHLGLFDYKLKRPASALSI